MAFDFDAAVNAPFRMQPGLRKLAPGAVQLTPSVVPHRGVARHLREKLAVLGAFAHQALLAEPGFDPAPALAALSTHAAAEHPQAWVEHHGADASDAADAAAPRPRWSAPWLGWALSVRFEPLAIGHDWPEIGPLLQSLPPAWRLPALLSLAFAEDFAIVQAPAGTGADPHPGRIPWLAVALPSFWAPEDKVGQPFTTVHAPVADNRMIQQAAAHLMRLVTGTSAAQTAGQGSAVPDRYERFVWTLTGHRRLHAHPARVDPERWPPALLAAGCEALAESTWLRTERQTFLPLPERAQAVFTIAVDTQPLPQAVAVAGRAARLHAALSTMGDTVLAYRGLQAARDPLLRWLAARAEADARQSAPAPRGTVHPGADPSAQHAG